MRIGVSNTAPCATRHIQLNIWPIEVVDASSFQRPFPLEPNGHAGRTAQAFQVVNLGIDPATTKDRIVWIKTVRVICGNTAK